MTVIVPKYEITVFFYVRGLRNRLHFTTMETGKRKRVSYG